MGVVQRLQSSRLASQLAFMMIEYIRRAAIANYGATRGEIGWVLDDNQGMNAIADAIESKVNKVYQLYENALKGVWGFSPWQIGRASCGERGCHKVKISV